MMNSNEIDDAKKVTSVGAEKETALDGKINASGDIGMKSKGMEGKGAVSRVNGSLPTDSLAWSHSSNARSTVPADSLASKGRKDASTKSLGRKPAAEKLKAPLMSNLANFIVEIPDHAKEGELFYIASSKLDSNHQIAIKVPPLEYILSGARPGNANKKRYMKIIISPQCSPSSSSENKPSKTESKARSIRYSPRRKKRRKSSRQINLELKQIENGNLNIGPNYQVHPSQIPNSSESHGPSTANELYEQIWNPTIIEDKFPQQVQNEIYYVLDNLPTNQKEIMMESLHKCNYNLEMAWTVMLKRLHELKSNGNLPGEPLSANVEQAFHDSIWESRKDLIVATKTAQKEEQISKCSLLVNYYGHYKPGEEYKKLKEMKEGESDYCQICNDGGVLICCDECSATYHLQCLDPPLDSVPEGSWFCSQCARFDLIQKHRAEITASEDLAEKIRKRKLNSNVNRCWKYWGINWPNDD